jgi:signal transduction histidine kinase
LALEALGSGGLDTDALDEHRLRRLIETGRALVSQLDLEVVLERIVEVARELTGAHYAALGILDDRRESLERFLTAGLDAETRATIGDLPRGRGVLGVLISDPRPLRLQDVGEHPRSYGFPPGHPPMKSFLGVPIMIRGEAYGNLYLTEKQGGEFSAADEQAVVILADWAAIAIDNARLYTAVWERRDELERAVRGLEASREIAHALGGETELERVLELIVKRGRALVEAGSLMILLDEEEQVVVAATAGEIGSGVIGRRLPNESLTPSSLRELGATAASTLFVPLAFRRERLGLLVALDRVVGGPEFGKEDEQLLRSFATSAAIAVHTAKSVADDRLRDSIAASELERRRWARELHDETLQGLAALQVVLSAALKRGSPEQLAAAVRDAVEQIGVEIQNLRSLIVELRPAALDELGLEPAIRSLTERTAAIEDLEVETGIDLSVGGGGAKRLPTELENTIYRLVQEALTNATKHAHAKRVVVEVVSRNGAVEVRVEDDGIGFDPARRHSGFGLRGMRERVALAGGTLELDSTSGGQGTRIRAVLPLRSPRVGALPGAD